jgi:hypothetical protein
VDLEGQVREGRGGEGPIEGTESNSCRLVSKGLGKLLKDKESREREG